MVFGCLFKIRWLYLVAGILWFVPITQIENMFIIIISATMLIVHGIMGFYTPKESDEW